MITLQKTDYQQMEQAAADAGVTLPIEQTDVWTSPAALLGACT